MVRYVSRKGSHKNFRCTTVGSTMHLTIRYRSYSAPSSVRARRTSSMPSGDNASCGGSGAPTA
jgi:hypothetical protein